MIILIKYLRVVFPSESHYKHTKLKYICQVKITTFFKNLYKKAQKDEKFFIKYNEKIRGKLKKWGELNSKLLGFIP